MVKSFLEAYDKNKADQLTREHVALQNKVIGQQLAQFTMAQNEYKAAQDRIAQRELEAKMSVPATADETETEAAPDEAEITPPSTPSPASVAQPRYNVATPSPNPAVPAMLSRFSPPQAQPTGASVAMNFAEPAAKAPVAPAGIPAFIGSRRKEGMSETAPWSPQNPIGVIDPQRIEDEMTTYSGRPNKANIQAEVDRRTKIKEGVLQASELKTTSNEIPNPNDGGRTLLTVDARTGTVLSSRPNKEHPEVAAEIAASSAEGTELGKSAVAFNNEITADARRAGASQARVSRMRDLLNYTGGLTGSAEDILLNAKGYAARLGYADADKVAKQQEFDALVKREQLDIVNETRQKGTTSDRERELYAQTVAGLGKSKQANLRILELTEASNLKAIAAERERQRLVKAGLNPRQIKEEMTKWIDADENFVENFVPKVERRVWNDQTQSTTRSKATPSSGSVSLPSGWKTN